LIVTLTPIDKWKDRYSHYFDLTLDEIVFTLDGVFSVILLWRHNRKQICCSSSTPDLSFIFSSTPDVYLWGSIFRVLWVLSTINACSFIQSNSWDFGSIYLANSINLIGIDTFSLAFGRNLKNWNISNFQFSSFSKYIFTIYLFL
jgi:hypothetical protein